MKHKFLFLLCLCSKIIIAQELVFRTNVENLRLREQPNLESKVIKTVPKGTALYWSGIRSEQKVIADWKGAKVVDYWYKVAFDFWNKDSIAWVFGKGLHFDGLKTSDSIQNIDNEWIRLEKSNQTSFNKIPITKVNWKPNKNFDSDILNDFTLKYDDGTSKIFKNENEEFRVDYAGEIPELGLYFLSYSSPCCESQSIVLKKNGKEINVPAINFHGGYDYFPSHNNVTPIFSKDKKTAIFTNGCEPDYEWGTGIYDFKDDNFINTFFWYNTYFDDFRFITNSSGIVKFQNDTYWKITIK